MCLILWQLENVPKPQCEGDFLSCRTIAIFKSGKEVQFPHSRENTHTIQNYWFKWLAGGGARGGAKVSSGV
jgi:hypothetical protein